jgi:hypothetical protein
VVAVDDDKGLVGEDLDLLEPLRNGVHGDEQGAVDAAGLVFAWLPDVEEDQFLTGVEARLHFGCGDFVRQVSHSVSPQTGIVTSPSWA